MELIEIEKLKKIIVNKIEKTNELWELIRCLDVCRHLALQEGEERGNNIGILK